jgi:hypothetical protein
VHTAETDTGSSVCMFVCVGVYVCVLCTAVDAVAEGVWSHVDHCWQRGAQGIGTGKDTHTHIHTHIDNTIGKSGQQRQIMNLYLYVCLCVQVTHLRMRPRCFMPSSVAVTKPLGTTT